VSDAVHRTDTDNLGYCLGPVAQLLAQEWTPSDSLHNHLSAEGLWDKQEAGAPSFMTAARSRAPWQLSTLDIWVTQTLDDRFLTTTNEHARRGTLAMMKVGSVR